MSKRSARSDWPQIITTTLVGFLSVLAVVAGVLVTNSANRAQERLTEEGQVTERFGSDIGLLGSSELDVRVGGIYALQRLMYDSPADEAKIVEVLSAFIRDHTPESLPASSHVTTSPCRSGRATSNGRPSHPADDAEAALEVLGSRLILAGNGSQFVMDLTWADISGASLLHANFDGADLRCAGLTRAYLIGASLRGAALRWAYLIRANLTGADLTGAHLPYTNLTHANLTHANLTHANLTHANLTHANLTSADLSSADLTGADLTGALWPTGAAVPEGWQRDSDSGRLKRVTTSPTGSRGSISGTVFPEIDP